MDTYYMMVSTGGKDVWEGSKGCRDRTYAEIDLWSEFLKIYHHTPRLRKIPIEQYKKDLIKLD